MKTETTNIELPEISERSRDEAQAKLKRRINHLLTEEAKLFAYYQLDPTFIHFHAAWQNLQQQFIGINIELKALILESPENSELTALQAKIKHCLPTTFDQQLDQLTVDLENGELNANELDKLASNPYFLRACKIDPSLSDKFKAIQQTHQEQLALAIANHSRYLFLQFTEAEMLSTKYSDNHAKIAEFFNHVFAYVVDEVLHTQSCNAGTVALHRWVGIAHKLYELSDFSSLYAVYNAINSNLCQFLLKNSHQGLSWDDKNFLEKIGALFSDSHLVENEIAERKQQGIPYIGFYRTRLEKAKAAGNESIKQNIIDQLSSMQVAVKSDTETSHSDNPLANWAAQRMPSGFDKLETEFYALAKAHPSKMTVQAGSSLYHFDQRCWLSRLRNPLLVEMLKERKIILPHDTTAEQINVINATFRKKMSDPEYGKTLQAVGIHFNEIEINLLNTYNRQAYYHNLIDNSVLRELLRHKHLHVDKLGNSTTDTILRLNKHLHKGSDLRTLKNDLTRLDITLTPEQWDQVWAQSQRDREAIHIPELVELLAQTKTLIAELNIRQFIFSETQNHLQDIIQLLNYSSELSAEDKEQLLTEIRCPFPGRGFETAATNPFIDKIDLLKRNMQRLQEIRVNLTDNHYDAKMSAKINRQLEILQRPHFQTVMQQHDLAKRWCEANGEPDADLQAEIKQCAKPISRFKQNFTCLEDLVYAKLAKIQQHIGLKIQKTTFDRLVLRCQTEFKPTLKAFKHETYSVDDSRVFSTQNMTHLQQQVSQADSFDACAKLEAELLSNRALQLFIALKNLRLELSQDTTLWLKARQHRGLDLNAENAQDNLSIEHQKIMQAIQYSSFDEEVKHITVPGNGTIIKEITDTNMETVKQIRSLYDVYQHLKGKMQNFPMPENYQAPVIQPVTKPELHDKKTHSALKWGATIAGTVAAGAVAAHVVGIAAVALAAKAVAVKVTAGAVAGSAGGAITNRCLSRFHLFKRNRQPEANSEETRPTVSPVS